MARRHLDLAAEVREEGSVRVLEHLNSGHRRHALDQPLRVVLVGREDGDVADDSLPFDTNDVERADVAAQTPDRRRQPAEHARPIDDATPGCKREARRRMLDHGAVHLDALQPPRRTGGR